MKKRNLLLVLLSLVCVVCMAFGFAACGKDPAPQYTITFSLGDYPGTESAPASVTDDEGTKITLPQVGVTWENHSFLGWKEGTDGDLLAAGSNYTVTKSATLTAQWQDNTPAEYTVTFALGEYTGTESAPAAKTETVNTQITLPDLDFTWDASHVFLGWKEGTDGDLLAAGSSYTVTKNATLTAQWRYRGESVGAQILGWFTEGTLQTAIDDGETVILEATFGGATLAWHGLWLDVNANDDWYRFRVDSAVETFNGGNSWANTTHASMQHVSIDRSAWNEEKYLALFASNTKVLQVATASLKDNVLTYTVATYAADDLKLKTPIVSSTYELTSTADIDTLNLAFYHDKNVTLDDGYLLAPQAPYEYVTFTFDHDYDNKKDVYDNIVVGKPYTFGTDPDRSGYTFLGWKTEGDDTLYKQGDTYQNVTVSLTFVAQWQDDTPTEDWVEFTGSATLTLQGQARTIVWLRIDTNSVDLAVTFKLQGDDTTIYDAQAYTDGNDDTYGRYYRLKGIAAQTFLEPYVYLKVSADKSSLTIYESGTYDVVGTLTVGGSVNPGPGPDDPAGDSKSISFGHDTNAPDGAPNTFPDLSSGEVGKEVTVPEITYSISHYTFKGWNVYKLVSGDWERDYDFSLIANGGSFTMPNYAIKLVSNFTKNYVTITFNSNGGSGEMAPSTSDFQYGNNLSEVSNKIKNKFTGPDGADFLYWSLTSDGPSIFANGSTMALTEANGVTADDKLTLYAIWNTTSVTPPPTPQGQSITDFVGKWDTELASDNHTIVVIAKSGANDVVGYAVLDGNAFITIFDLEGTLFASNTDDEKGKAYSFALSDNGHFTLTIYDFEDNEETYTFTKKENVPTASEDAFLGKWKKSATQRLLIEANGAAYYSYNGIKSVTLTNVGEYLVFSYTSGYYFILTKSGDGLTGYFLASDKDPVEANFTANGFYTLKVDGKYVEFVNEGSKPTAIAAPTAPSGQKFDGWVLADSDTPFDFDKVMTADASIVAKFVDDTTEPAPTEGDYTGASFSIQTGVSTNATVTSLSFNDDFTKVTLFFEDGHSEECTITDVTSASWLPGYNPEAAKGDSVYQLKYTSYAYEYYLSFDASKTTVKVYNEDDDLLATLTKAGGSQGGDVTPPATSTLLFKGTYGAGANVIVKIEINPTTNEITLTTKSANGSETKRDPVVATFANGVWSLTSSQNPRGENIWLKVSEDGNSLKIYDDSDMMEPRDLLATFTKEDA